MEAVGKLLPTIFKKHLRRQNAHVVEVLAPFWFRVAGKEIAEHSRPIAFEAGTLILGVSCPSWAGQLLQMTEELRTRVNIFLSCSMVKKVQVRFMKNLDRIELTMRPDDFTMVEARKTGAANGETNFDPRAERIFVRSEAKVSARADKRLD